MKELVDITKAVPWWILLTAGAVFAAIVVVIIIFAQRAAFRKRLRKVAVDPGLAEKEILNRYSKERLLRKSGVIENVAKKAGEHIIPALGIDRLWIDRLAEKKRLADFRRVIRFAPDKGLFTCFLASLEKPKFSEEIDKWLKSERDLLALRYIALSGRGEEFDGSLALETFRNRLNEIREMMGDPEWPPRYFAVKVMLHDDDELSRRALWEALTDAHPLIRATVVREFQPEEMERLYNSLRELYLDDPVLEVRSAAKERLLKEFSEIYSIDASSLSEVQAFHVLELLADQSKQDEDLALRFAESENLELRLLSARHLQKLGTLDRHYAETDLGDRKNLKRTENLLTDAAAVSVTGFLSALRGNPSLEQLLMGGHILAKYGDRSLIRPALQKALAVSYEIPERDEIIDGVLEALHLRGQQGSFELAASELWKRRSDHDDSVALVTHLPPRAEPETAETLFKLLLEEGIQFEEELIEAIIKLPSETGIGRMIDIIQAGREQYSHTVRLRALRVLLAYKKPYLLQFLLEHLPILPGPETRDFTVQLAAYTGKTFDERAVDLLDGPDAKVRASLISALPSTGKKDFLKQIREALGDSDPDVRIASIWALAEFGDTRSLNQAADMLRDPVTRVRTEAARALGTYGSDTKLKTFQDILGDENEVEPVKLAAIEGLGASKSKTAIDVLVEASTQEEELLKPAVAALTGKTTMPELTYLIEKMKDAGPKLRDILSEVFTRIGEDGEDAMESLLREDIASLRSYLNEILENTGYVENVIRKLNHRDPAIRRQAAHTLSLVGTKAAFRGIVLAARDPDEDVRVNVTKALETLNTDTGKEILEELQNDPEKRIRKYTLWALQRMEAKAL
jgi:HEAT repeat protein